MAFGSCKHCGNSYFYPDTAQPTGFCSDGCFGLYSTGKKGFTWWKKLLLAVVIIGLLVAWAYRIDLAFLVMQKIPEYSTPITAFAAWCGPESVSRAIKTANESEGAVRRACLVLLEQVDDPVAAREEILKCLPALDKLYDELAPEEQMLFMAGLGRCQIREWKGRFTDAVAVPQIAEGAVKALGYLGDRDSLSMLCGLLGHEGEVGYQGQPKFLATVVEAIGRIPDPERTALKPLKELLGARDPSLRKQAAIAIGRVCSDRQEIIQGIGNALSGDRKAALKFKLDRIDEALGALQVAGRAEREDDVRRAMSDAVVVITDGSKPNWAK